MTHGLTQIHNIPIERDNEIENTKLAIDKIDKCVRAGQNVFVYCSTGITRCATVALTYLRFYKRIKVWNDQIKSEDSLKLSSPITLANPITTQKVLEQYKKEHDAQLDLIAEQIKQQYLKL